MENNQLSTEVHQAEVQVNFFQSKELFEHVQRVASMFSKSDLIPQRYKDKPGNCVIALEMANRIGASPLMVMQNLDIILGKPAWSSKFLIATLNASGKFSPLRYEEDEQSGGRTRAWAYDKGTNEKIYGAWVSMEMAKAEGWIDKNGSKWKTMPELMRRYRAASFFTNQFAPEISMGLATVDEVYDVTPIISETPKPESKQDERMELLISDCTTIEEVNALRLQAPDFDPALFEKRIAELTPPGLTEDELNSISLDIETAESVTALNKLWAARQELQNESWFKTAINQKKISLGKVLKGATA